MLPFAPFNLISKFSSDFFYYHISHIISLCYSKPSSGFLSTSKSKFSKWLGGSAWHTPLCDTNLSDLTSHFSSPFLAPPQLHGPPSRSLNVPDMLPCQASTPLSRIFSFPSCPHIWLILPLPSSISSNVVFLRGLLWPLYQPRLPTHISTHPSLFYFSFLAFITNMIPIILIYCIYCLSLSLSPLECKLHEGQVTCPIY